VLLCVLIGAAQSGPILCIDEGHEFRIESLWANTCRGGGVVVGDASRPAQGVTSEAEDGCGDCTDVLLASHYLADRKGGTLQAGVCAMPGSFVWDGAEAPIRAAAGFCVPHRERTSPLVCSSVLLI